MKNSLRLFRYYLLFTVSLGLISCSSSRNLTDEGFQQSPVDAETITAEMPDYQEGLHSVEGKGRAIVSEPGNTERVTILFSSNRDKSLVTVRSGIGIEGGQLLTDGDTLIVYNKVDEYIRKIPVAGGDLDHINKLASLNILEIINFAASAEQVRTVWENNSVYRLELTTGTQIYVDKQSHLVQQVQQPSDTDLPYSRITYDSYGSLEGFELPRRITIFGTGEKSKIALQLTSMELNTDLDSLTINLPDDIPVYHQ